MYYVKNILQDVLCKNILQDVLCKKYPTGCTM